MGKHKRDQPSDELIRRILDIARPAALRLGASEHEAQEVAQVTAFKIWSNWDKPHIRRAMAWQDVGRWESYIRRAARNTHYDLVRGHQRRIQREEKASAQEGLAQRSSLTPDNGSQIEFLLAQAVLAEEIMKLPAQQRRVATRVYIEDMTVREVAEELGVQTQSVRKLLRGANTKLRIALRQTDRQPF